MNNLGKCLGVLIQACALHQNPFHSLSSWRDTQGKVEETSVLLLSSLSLQGRQVSNRHTQISAGSKPLLPLQSPPPRFVPTVGQAPRKNQGLQPIICLQGCSTCSSLHLQKQLGPEMGPPEAPHFLLPWLLGREGVFSETIPQRGWQVPSSVRAQVRETLLPRPCEEARRRDAPRSERG